MNCLCCCCYCIYCNVNIQNILLITVFFILFFFFPYCFRLQSKAKNIKKNKIKKMKKLRLTGAHVLGISVCLSVSLTRAVYLFSPSRNLKGCRPQQFCSMSYLKSFSIKIKIPKIYLSEMRSGVLKNIAKALWHWVLLPHTALAAKCQSAKEMAINIKIS